jgi:hypothetical protein
MGALRVFCCTLLFDFFVFRKTTSDSQICVRLCSVAPFVSSRVIILVILAAACARDDVIHFDGVNVWVNRLLADETLSLLLLKKTVNKLLRGRYGGFHETSPLTSKVRQSESLRLSNGAVNSTFVLFLDGSPACNLL